MTITAQPRNNVITNCYVYYDDWTGEIISVGKSERQGIHHPFLLTSGPIVESIMNGDIIERNYIVSTDSVGKDSLVEKNNIFKLRSKEYKLYTIPESNNHYDIRCKIFKRNKKMVVSINTAMLHKLVATKKKQQYKMAEDESYFEFFIVKKNSPDYLIQVIKLNAEELFNTTSISVDIASVTQFTDIDDISILTFRYFENYIVEFADETFVETTNVDKCIWNQDTFNSYSHITMSQEKNILSIKSNVSAEQLSSIKLFGEILNLFVVGRSPDNFLGTLRIDISSLRSGKVLEFDVDFILADVTLMFNNPLLIINKENK